jgi:3-oxoadipate enol-lactonase
VTSPFDVRGARLAVKDSGSAPDVLVWLHGMQGTMAGEEEGPVLYAPQSCDSLRVIRYDARSHGLSSTSGDASDHTWPSLALDLLGVVDALGLGRFFLGGPSMGAATALHFAMAHAARVRGLVLTIPPTAWELRAAQRSLYAAAVEVVRRGGMEAFATLTAQRPQHPVASETGDAWLTAHLRRLRGMDPEGVALALQGAIESDLPDPALLATLNVPALILSWPGDPTHPERTASLLAAMLPNARYEPATALADVLTWPTRISRWCQEQATMERTR